MTLYCPAHIEFLLWCHTRAERFPQEDLALYQSLITRLLNAGAIEKRGDCYATTPKGAAWIEMLCNVEEPRVAFIDAAGKVIDVPNGKG